MNELLITIMMLVENNPRKNELLRILTESYLLDRKWFILSRWLDENVKVVKDLDKLKKGKYTKIKSRLVREQLSSLNSSDYSNQVNIIKRDIQDPLEYYYLAFLIIDILKKSNRSSMIKYIITALISILSILAAYIVKYLEILTKR
jgi:hypothetical protein